MAYRVGRSPNGGAAERTSGEYYGGGAGGGSGGGHGRSLSLKNKRRYALYSEILQSLQDSNYHDDHHHHHHHHHHHYHHEHHHEHHHDQPIHHHVPKRVKGHHYAEQQPQPQPLPDSYDARPPLVTQQQQPVAVAAAAAAAPSPPEMERTASGLSISSDTGDYINPADEDDAHLLSDDDAAQRVVDHIAHMRPDTQSERILRSMVNPRHDYRLDDSALLSLFSAANELFFRKKLDRRVAWDWSHSSSEQYASHIVGTTALRRSATRRGYETLIVLSTPILKDTSFNRRLLISTFLHEMIHSYLFVTCGLKAKENGGHTPGFRRIASAIDDWVGKDYLHLRDMEADLERYRGEVTRRSHTCGDDHQDQQQQQPHAGAWAPSYPLEEEEPYRTRSPASHPNWHWADREDFGAPRHTRTDVLPHPHAAAFSPSIATYVPPSYHHHHNHHHHQQQQQQPPYPDEHYQHPPPMIHRYHQH